MLEKSQKRTSLHLFVPLSIPLEENWRERRTFSTFECKFDSSLMFARVKAAGPPSLPTHLLPSFTDLSSKCSKVVYAYDVLFSSSPFVSLVWKQSLPLHPPDSCTSLYSSPALRLLQKLSDSHLCKCLLSAYPRGRVHLKGLEKARGGKTCIDVTGITYAASKVAAKFTFTAFETHGGVIVIKRAR